MRSAQSIACVTLVLALTACGAASAAVRWRDVRSVRVTVSNGSLPPPYGAPRTTVFRTSRQVSRAEAALNAHHIRRVSGDSSSNDGGCTGGYNAVITIVERDKARVTMSAYRCATTTYGTIGGDLPGFLAALAISPP
jgi:hypothetical protein